MSDLRELAAALTNGITPAARTRVAGAAGMAAKAATLAQVERDLGSDRRFSNMRRKVQLGTGFDITNDAETVQMNYRPGGLFLLAERGRIRSGDIRPRRGRPGRNGRPAALRTPYGYLRSSSFRPSRGLRTLTNAIGLSMGAVTDATGDAIMSELREVIGDG